MAQTYAKGVVLFSSSIDDEFSLKAAIAYVGEHNYTQETAKILRKKDCIIVVKK